jgi:hypothetical protein
MVRTLVITVGAICLLAALLLSIAIILRQDPILARIGGLLWIAGPILILFGRRLKRLT